MHPLLSTGEQATFCESKTRNCFVMCVLQIIHELSAENEELKGELEQAATGATADGSGR